jgi:quinol monooxygenase YgiN
MASRFDLRTLGAVPRFFLASLRIRRQMLASPGVLGVSVIAKPLSKTFFTLSAWQDRDALDAAVARQPHAQTMAYFHSRMAQARFVFWTMPRSDLPPRWVDAFQQLQAARSE